jgi:hypothetical protein
MDSALNDSRDSSENCEYLLEFKAKLEMLLDTEKGAYVEPVRDRLKKASLDCPCNMFYLLVITDREKVKFGCERAWKLC